MNLTSLLGVQHKKLNIWASSVTTEKTVQIIIQLVLTRSVTYLKGASVSCNLKYITYCKHAVFELKVIRTPLCCIFFCAVWDQIPSKNPIPVQRTNSSTSIHFSSTLIDLVKEVGTVVSKNLSQVFSRHFLRNPLMHRCKVCAAIYSLSLEWDFKGIWFQEKTKRGKASILIISSFKLETYMCQMCI